MSGGIAYVLDVDNEFAQHCNLEMVDLELLDEATEKSFVRFLIERHANYTDSAYARHILEKWEENSARFVKVMPLDYRRVLNEGRAKTKEMAQHG